MSTLGMTIAYDGDPCEPILGWFQRRLVSIQKAFDGDSAEACLTQIYSGLDTFGWLGAPQAATSATRTSFIDWCDKYVLKHLPPETQTTITSIALYAARCSVLHTSNATSKLSADGAAPEIYYSYEGLLGVNFFSTTPLQAVILDVEHLANAFKQAGIEFMTDLNADAQAASLASSRAQTFIRWGRPVQTSEVVPANG